ncbi:MAG TPA: PAS domain S-box protein, partial [Polyangiales bacterium]|nr:PAS domain S-box protein [Polyangiales bacterium]
AARADPPDLIITDIMMPVLDGFGLLRALRETEHTRGIPVLMLSARAGEEAKVEGFDAGAEDYLTKPFSARELIARVRTHLELAQARRRLKEDRERLYSFFMQAPVPICVFRGRELVFELANPLYHEVAGHDDLLGKTLLEGIPEARGQGFDVLLRRVMESGKPYIGREELVRLDRDHDGVPENVYFNFIYAPIQSELGVIDRVMAVVHDVTDQVQARQAVERSEERFRRLVSQIQAGIAQTDLTGRFTLVNERFREIVGRSEAELKRLRMQDLTHPDDLTGFAAQLAQLVQHGNPFVLESRFLKADGSVVWVQSSVSRLDDRDGRPQATAAVVIDITQRKDADQVLIESEERFRAMADHAPVMVWAAEADGRCTFLGQTWYAFTGQAVETSLGFGWLDAVHPEDRGGVQHSFELATQKREAFRREYRLRRHDGEYRWTIDAATPRLGPNGAFLGFIGCVIDITERQALEAARLAEMQRAIRFSDMFVGILGHDLRNPLSAITTAAYLLETRAESDKIAKPVRRIAASADRMERMISQLLDFTRVRLGRGIPLTYAEVDLAEMARAAVDELDSVHTREIRLEREGNTVGVWDADRLAQLLSNLIANACQHGSAAAPVVVRVDGRNASQVELHVMNGGAIPADVLPVIFEPLRQSGDRPVKREGSSGLGLGLYITQQIALAHGGTIEVESNAHSGTRFSVRLRRDSSARDASRDSATVFSVENAS